MNHDIEKDGDLDLKTSLQFYRDGEPRWALINTCSVFMPFVFRFISFIEEFKRNGSKFRCLGTQKALRKAGLCLPFVKTYHAVSRLRKMREQAVFLTSATKLNKVMKENSQSAIFEAFLEAAPCQILNIYIFLVTGTIMQTQVASTGGFMKKVLSVYTHSMTTIYLSLSAQVAISTFFMKSPLSSLVCSP